MSDSRIERRIVCLELQNWAMVEAIYLAGFRKEAGLLSMRPSERITHMGCFCLRCSSAFNRLRNSARPCSWRCRIIRTKKITAK